MQVICLQVYGSGEPRDSKGSEENGYGNYRGRGLHRIHGDPYKKIVFSEEEMDELEKLDAT